MKPRDAIREALTKFVTPRLARLGFSFSSSSLGFKRIQGDFTQRIYSHLDRWNAEDISASFYFSFAIHSRKYVKWHLNEYGVKPVNDFVASEMYWNLHGWKHARPNAAHPERNEIEMLNLLEDTLDVGIPFLEKYSDWDAAARLLVSKRWFHAKASDFCLIAGNREAAHWCLREALTVWRQQPNRSFFVGEREDVYLRLAKHFQEVSGDGLIVDPI